MSGPTTETIMLPLMRIPTFPPTGITTIPCTRVTTATAALATALAVVHALSKAVDRGLPRTDRMKTSAGRGHCPVILESAFDIRAA
jgi:hypothetical protein